MKTRTKAIIMFIAALLLTTVIVLPRIIEAKRLRAAGDTLASPPITANVNQDEKGEITVVASYHNDTSKPLRDMKPMPVFSKGQHENENPKIPHKHKDEFDPVVQDSFGALKSFMAVNMPAPILNFNGIQFPG